MNAPVQPRRSRAWWATGLLTLSGLPAGSLFTSSFCYWQGRTFGRGSRYEGVLPNWRPDLAPAYVVTLAVGAAWVVLWLLHARRARNAGMGYVHGVVPGAAFVFSAVVLSSSAMACGAY